MKKFLTVFFLILIGKIALAQDVSVIAITAPVSGCSLSATSSVTINVKNIGLTDLSGVPIDLSYTINAGVPVTAAGVSFPFFTPNTTVSYTFTTTANLSVAGSYTFTAYSTLATDINNTNNATTGWVVVSTAPSNGGTVTGTNVCIGSNSGTLTLSGETGSVLNWEYSTDGGTTWISISNTTTSQSYTNLTVQTKYRAKVQNGICPVATSTIATMTIDPLTVGGTVSGTATVCTGSNGGTMTSSGKTGTILRWQFSTDGGATWTDIANTTSTQTYLNLVTTTRYRVEVQSGACTSAFSSVAVITVSPLSVGGTVGGGATVCSGTNSGNLTLTGQTGTVSRWEYSINGGTTWTNNTNTATTQPYLNLVSTTYYRALVKSGLCSATYSSIDSIVVSPTSVGGSISSNATLCSGSNGGTLTLSGYAGTIQYWEYSINGGTTYTAIANISNTQSYLNLVTTTRYRANVKNGGCPSANSSVAIITVNPVSVGGTTTFNDTVCSGSNSGTINLSGNTGSVTKWESSPDGSIWTDIANTTLSQSYTNIINSTFFRAIITSGVCPSASSSIDSIYTDAPTVGGTVSTSSNVCYGNNSGTLNLIGNTGNVVRWEYSIDGGINWLPINNTTTSYIYNNIILTTKYRTIVQSGTCSSAISGVATLTVDPVSVGGTISGGTTACGGSNSGTLDLINYVGTIQNWESSTDGGATWTPIVNSTASYNFVNIATPTLFRVIVKSGTCSSVYSATTSILVDPPSVGGTLSIDDVVCANSNSGTLNLAGETGSIQHWESSIDGGLTWLTLANTGNSQNYSNLTTTTMYRVFVKSGVCNGTTSNSVTITVFPVAIGGSISGGTTFCDTINSGTLLLNGSIGNILNWESSTDGGATWAMIANTGNTQTFTNLLDTTLFRAIVSSGICGKDTSSSAVVYINPPTKGGSISANDTVCTGANSGVLHLTGYSGSILNWESSTDGGYNWAQISNVTDSLTYINLTLTTVYHAHVKSGICNADTSLRVTITVNPLPVGGTISGGGTVCDTINSGTLTLNGFVGTILNWESSTNEGLTWSSIANNTASQSFTNLLVNTTFRAIVSSGICGKDTSSTATIYINPLTKAGNISTNDTVCAGTNLGVLHLTNYLGSILNWESSVDGGYNWTQISNTTDSLTYHNLSVTTIYRANVKSGICNADTSLRATITINPHSVGGSIIGAAPGCSGNNSGILTLTGYVGGIQNWESSIDGGLTWSTIVNSTSSENYLNLIDSTIYRTIVQSIGCIADTSLTSLVVVYPKPNAVISADTACFENANTFVNSSTISSGIIQFNQWDFGDGNNSLSNSPTHLYATAGIFAASLLTTSNYGCMDTANVNVLVNTLPPSTITASGPLRFCSYDSLTLSASAGAYYYIWSTLESSQSITVHLTGTYVLTIIDTISACFAKDSVDATVLPIPSVSAGNDISLSLGSSITLNASGIGVVSWSWFPNTGLSSASIPDPIASPIITSTYELIGTDINGCIGIDSLTITVLTDYNVTVSNLMTPNDDGYNDRWIVQNLENYPNTQVYVVDRDGQIVFKSDAYDNNWDGTNTYGKVLPDGTYYYIIKFENSDKLYKGSITILREGSK